MSQSLLNEVKYSNQRLPEGAVLDKGESQSLLNEVKYSNKEHVKQELLMDISRNPF